MSHDTLDHKLVIHLQQTLDTASQQADEFDKTLAILAKKASATRQEKLRHSLSTKTKAWFMGSVVVVASLSFAILPSIFISPTQQAAITASQTLNNLTVSNVDPQLLEDLEMVATLGDENNEN